MLATREADTPSRVEGRLRIDESITGAEAVVASKRNARIVLIAFAALFNKRDYAPAERLWSANYVQHSADDPLGLFDLVTSRPRLIAI